MRDIPPEDRELLGRLRGMAYKDPNGRICIKLTPKEVDLDELTSGTGDWLTPLDEEDWSEL
jgi:hypothetical protein